MSISCCENVEIERVDNISADCFKINYMKPGRPVIIDGAINDWPARQWTLDVLSEKVGSKVVHVRHNTNCEEYRSGRQYGVRQTTFAEYVADLQANNSRAKNSYLAVQNIRKAVPELQHDIRVPDYIEKVHGGPYLWIANAGHYEYCHFDPDDGLLAIVKGSKQVRLFAAADLESLYPNDLGTKGRTVQAQVNCDDPDLSRHPLFAETRCHYGTLLPGQLLYIPAFWWHQVTTLEVSISINVFWGDGGERNYLTKIMAPPIWPSFRYWLLNIIEQNRSCVSFRRTLARFEEALREFLMTQWHETICEEQLNVLQEVVLQYLALDGLPQDIESRDTKHPPRLRIRGLLWRS